VKEKSRRNEKTLEKKTKEQSESSESEDEVCFEVRHEELAPQPHLVQPIEIPEQTVEASDETSDDDEDDQVPVQRNNQAEYEVTLRRSSRVKTKPKWQDSYVMSQRQVGDLDEKTELLTKLICSEMQKTTSPTLVERVVNSIVK
jgi:hypothetical protein